MLLCKQATNSKCGKNCCCYYCEEKETCADDCSLYDEVQEAQGCVDAYDETTALQEFHNDFYVMEVMQTIANISKQKEALEAEDKKIRNILKEKMQEFGIKSFENDILKVTYVAPTTKVTIDSKKLKKDLPDIAKKYSNTSNVSASVRISVK